MDLRWSDIRSSPIPVKFIISSNPDHSPLSPDFHTLVSIHDIVKMADFLFDNKPEPDSGDRDDKVPQPDLGKIRCQVHAIYREEDQHVKDPVEDKPAKTYDDSLFKEIIEYAEKKQYQENSCT